MKKIDLKRRKTILALPALAVCVGTMASACAKGVAHINHFKCKGCMQCASACSQGAISKVAGIVRVDSSKCTGCGACVYECGNSAISV